MLNLALPNLTLSLLDPHILSLYHLSVHGIFFYLPHVNFSNLALLCLTLPPSDLILHSAQALHIDSTIYMYIVDLPYFISTNCSLPDGA